MRLNQSKSFTGPNSERNIENVKMSTSEAQVREAIERELADLKAQYDVVVVISSPFGLNPKAEKMWVNILQSRVEKWAKGYYKGKKVFVLKPDSDFALFLPRGARMGSDSGADWLEVWSKICDLAAHDNPSLRLCPLSCGPCHFEQADAANCLPPTHIAGGAWRAAEALNPRAHSRQIGTRDRGGW